MVVMVAKSTVPTTVHSLKLACNIQSGLRLSELTGLARHDVDLGTGAHVRVIGKGRKERCTPLTKQTVAGLAPGTCAR